VNDGKAGDIAVNCNNDSLSANWSSSADPNSAVVKYWYSVGTSPGAANIQTWTSSFTGTAVTTTSVALTQNTIYYFNIQAEDGAGLLSNIISSNGQKVDTLCVLGMSEIDLKDGFAVYPNPFSNAITVQLYAIEGDVKIILTDVLGREVLFVKPENTSLIKTISTSQLAQGIYWLKVENGKKSFVSKLIKE
jgi:hypothetical protein